MFKLSRKGWNNVIIVVVLIVITLLHRLELAQQENSAKRARPLLPDSAVVLTWQGPSWQIERIGQGWRSGRIWGSAVPSWRRTSRPGRAGCCRPANPCAATRLPSRSGSPARAIPSRWASIRTAASLPPCCPRLGSA